MINYKMRPYLDILVFQLTYVVSAPLMKLFSFLLFVDVKRQCYILNAKIDLHFQFAVFLFSKKKLKIIEDYINQRRQQDNNAT